jgi:hypothetical protein
MLTKRQQMRDGSGEADDEGEVGFSREKIRADGVSRQSHPRPNRVTCLEFWRWLRGVPVSLFRKTWSKRSSRSDSAQAGRQVLLAIACVQSWKK